MQKKSIHVLHWLSHVVVLKKIIIKNWLNPVFFLCKHYTKGNVIKINKLFCTLFSDQKVKISQSAGYLWYNWWFGIFVSHPLSN